MAEDGNNQQVVVALPLPTPATPSQDISSALAAPFSDSTDKTNGNETDVAPSKKINFKKYVIPMWGIVADLRRRIPWYLHDIKVKIFFFKLSNNNKPDNYLFFE